VLVRVLLAVKGQASRDRFRQCLQDEAVLVDSVRGTRRLWERLSRESGDLIVIERDLIPEPVLQTLCLLRELPDSPGVVVVTGEEDPAQRAALLTAGAEAVVNSGLPDEALGDVLATLVGKRQRIVEETLVPGQVLAEPRLNDFVSLSPAMKTFMETVHRVADSDTTLLLLGETGVGKERLARAVHRAGRRVDGPFVAVNCGALPEGLLESDLFGHEEGAFTGATRSRRGCFELAHGGTLFLDEVGEMPPHVQVKLLRALQDRVVQRVGGEREIHVDVRIMAASNRELVTGGEVPRFRRDLYYRLSVVTLTIPPLRERREDIPTLVESYIAYLRPRIGRSVSGISAAAMAALTRYGWQGNVRELINVIERAMLLCRAERIDTGDLPEEVGVASRRRDGGEGHETETAEPLGARWLDRPWREVRRAFLESAERRYFDGLLARTGGRVGETARLAGMEPRSLYEKMRRYGLQKEFYRGSPRSPTRRGDDGLADAKRGR
jgi:DNA-binding NtrC family response regulator